MLVSDIPRLKKSLTCMEKIDRLRWEAGISFVSFGARIGIRVNDFGVLGRLRHHLPPNWKSATSPVVDYLYSVWIGDSSARVGCRRNHLLYGAGDMLVQTNDLDELVRCLESALHFNVAIAARRKLFVHAGVVGWRGRAIVIPGRSFTGKTTLVAALLQGGATYYSDEYAVFDRHGRVHPYQKPLTVREQNGLSAKKRLVVHAGTTPLPVGLVAVTEYKPSVPWSPRVPSPGELLLDLFANTILARIQPQLAFATLQRVVVCALALKGKRGEAEDIVAPLLDHLSDPVTRR